ncbi:MAG: Lrp/AsnC family transcriptional regulator [Solirubrobacteraceae bacterium]|nr:Lrp/AsnC family transcriptional regulator [Solirubrobacteraceae bacterium]
MSLADLDAIDEQILALLREDARRTVTDIASRVSLSAAPVARRIERMERLGVIAGYTVVLDHSKVGPSLDAFTELRIVGNIDAEEVVVLAKEIPEVQEVWTIAGDPDVLLRLRVEDVAHLQQVVNALRRSGKVTGTKTLMALGRWERTV